MIDFYLYWMTVFKIEYVILCQQYDRMQLDELVEIMLESFSCLYYFSVNDR